MFEDYEKLGVFYLGRAYDFNERRTLPDQILYESKDLTTHAVCVGMTGSGKTGLGIAMLEEAAIDGIPVIAIDPKGDLGNLMLTFPDLDPGSFEPWMEAATPAQTIERAKETAKRWREGLASWNQRPERIARFQNAAEPTLFTPGSRIGRPMTVLRSFSAPSPDVMRDPDALRDRILGSVSGLLSLLRIPADPLRSREHILLSTLIDAAWREGRDLDLAGLIRGIQKPGITKLGVFDLESFYPQAERFQLAMTLNSLLASPGFSAWMEGEPLEIGNLLYTAAGKPRLSILSIAHLSDAERMFFVTLLLNEMISWMRTQPGTGSLRAVLYMDEVFGYFPPTANPPSKLPMLTLLKQARAFGIGIVLSTQNPVDLDYKGLSNAGTWFLGRLQTERDKARVIEGLEGASAAAGARFDRGRIETILSGLGNRVFMMNNVHDDEPVIFQTRWALSYLAGPLSREQLKRLTPRDQTQPAATAAADATEGSRGTRRGSGPPSGAMQDAASNSAAGKERPMVPGSVPERFLVVTKPAPGRSRMIYRPGLLALATAHYANARSKIDEWRRMALLTVWRDDPDSLNPWQDAAALPDARPVLDVEPDAAAGFAPLPDAARRPKSFVRWSKMCQTHVYRHYPLVLWKCAALKAVSRPGESIADFQGRLHDLIREERDDQLEALRKKYMPKVKRIQDKIQAAQHRVERETDQYQEQKTGVLLSLGATLVGALFGRKLGSSRNVGRAVTTARGARRTVRERGDIQRASERLDRLQRQLDELETEFEAELDKVKASHGISDFECEEIRIAPRKSDLAVDQLFLAWIPCWIRPDGSIVSARHDVVF